VVRARAALAALWLAAPAGADTPLCRAEVRLEPERAFVGQPVLHRLRIEVRRDVADWRWETSLSFPAFRAERILGPGGPPERGAEHEVVEERRVLFPARAGRLSLPPARLACESPSRLESVEVPAAALVAEEPPLEGRPPDWAGLVGPVEVTVYATPDRIALGESVSVSVSVEGTGNVWTAPVALALPPGAAEVFERPSELARDMGRVLTFRAYRSFDVVPRRAGSLTLPELRVAWFDPERRRYAESRAPAVEIRVEERAAGAAAPGPAAEAPAAARAPARTPRWAPAAALGLALAAGGAALWLRRRGSRARAGAGGAGEARAAQAALDAALAAGDAAAAAGAAARALRLALEAELPGARSLAVEELEARAPGARVALLARVERARFAGAAPDELLALAREAAAADR
jgi:hypothetical protein